MANFFDNVGQKAKDFTEQTKLNGELGKLRDQRMGMFAQLGQMYYDYRKREGGQEPDYSQLIAAIDSVNANTKAIEERIAVLKGGQACPKCGAIVQQGARFCPSCGQEIPQPQMQSIPVGNVNTQFYGQPQGTTCANCGHPLAMGIKFCPKCGAATAQGGPNAAS